MTINVLGLTDLRGWFHNKKLVCKS